MIGKGGFGDVLRGTLVGRASPVAIKRLRSHENQDIRVACVSGSMLAVRTAMQTDTICHSMYQRLAREMTVWSRLKHPNVLALLGFYLSADMGEALIICPWEPQGNIQEYLRQRCPDDHARLELVSSNASSRLLLVVLIRRYLQRRSTPLKEWRIFTASSRQ